MRKILLFFIFTLSYYAYGQDSDTVNTSYQENSYTNYERIIKFNSDIIVNLDASITVTETITVNATGNQISRGIFRSLPFRRNLNNQRYKLNYQIISVKKDGIDEDYHQKTDDEWIKYYFGSADKYIDPGIYTYEFKYRVNKQIGFFTNYDELYWNTTGTEWDFPIDSVITTVHLPKETDIIQNACYTGIFGSTETNCKYSIIDNNTITWTTTNLAAKEGLTIAVGFNKNIITAPALPNFIETYGFTIVLVIAFCWFLTYCYKLWKKYGIDPIKPTVHPQFSPPDNLSPAAVGYFQNEKINDNFFSASIINLAIKGYISIEDRTSKKMFGLVKSKYYRLTQLKNSNISLPNKEAAILHYLFIKNSSIIIDGDYDKSVENAMLNCYKKIRDNYESIIDEGRNLHLLNKPTTLLIIVYLLALIIGRYIEGYPETLTFVLIVLVALGIPYMIIKFLSKSKKNIIMGCLKIFLVIQLFFGLISFGIMSIISFINSIPSVNTISSFIFLITGLIILLIMRYLIKKPSEKKLRIQAEIEGFKMYIASSEKEKLQFHNAPILTPEIFEKYLPYAIIFEVDQIWGKKFDTLLTQTATYYESTWYHGNLSDTRDLGTSLSKTLQNSTSKPSSGSSFSSSSSSGGSSSSGSSGSGSSGGGGGGGGGGGW